MKKILVVTETFFPENFIINDLVKQWQDDGYLVDILTQWPSYPEGKIYPGYENKQYAIEQWGTSKIHRFKLIEGYKDSKIKKILNYWKFVNLGTKIAKKIGGNYEHIFIHQTGPLTLALPAVAMKKKYGIPITIWTFDIWPDAIYAYGFPKVKPLEMFIESIIKRVYGNSDNILVSSKRFADTISKYVPNRKIAYVPNWLLKEKFVESELRLDRSKFNFTFTGNISMAQNLENTIKGFTKANIKDAVLNIVGDGSKFNELKSLIEDNKIENVVLHGRFPYNQMADIMKQSDTLLMPLIGNSGIEKTEPLKLQSYLMSGKPIMGILNGSGREIIEENGLGICALPYDIDDISQKFIESIEFARSNGAEVAKQSLKLIDDRFNREKIISKINSIIDN